MNLHGKMVQIVELPAGWWGKNLIHMKGIAMIDEEASSERGDFYHLVRSDVPEYLLFHESRLRVIE